MRGWLVDYDDDDPARIALSLGPLLIEIGHCYWVGHGIMLGTHSRFIAYTRERGFEYGSTRVSDTVPA